MPDAPARVGRSTLSSVAISLRTSRPLRCMAAVLLAENSVCRRSTSSSWSRTGATVSGNSRTRGEMVSVSFARVSSAHRPKLVEVLRHRVNSGERERDNGGVTLDDAGRSPLTGKSAQMSRQRRRDTGPELAIRAILHRQGLRYRVDYPLPGLARRRADIVFTRYRIAVFIDGCFWHRCPEHATMPKVNADWWERKLATNVARDRETDDHLKSIGWTVCRVWEHEPAESAAASITRVLLSLSQ
jgi:DNA mismatch endonuclease (patch repair protein)